jgi:para-aminobenzoate synthetase/4-amino-4-deoxychorismate lyase
MKADILSDTACFALLDDASAADDPSQRRSRLYTGLVERLEVGDAAAMPDFFSAIQVRLSAGQAVVGLFSYELGAAMHGISERPDGASSPACALVFQRCEHLSRAEVDQWIRDQLAVASCTDFCINEVIAGMDAPSFRSAVEKIHRYIASGDTYQVNLTFPFRLTLRGNPLALYAALREQQPVPYGALIALPDGQSVLSLSPELFLSHQQGRLLAKPMKGTLAASDDGLDDALAATLAASPKNRSENLMIVDLLRNDLGRIAQTGSVKVPALFEVQRYGQVLQMTSTIEARRRAGVTLTEVFDAVYPCGSITGAPKRRTMQILRELEMQARGLYTGAIGWFDPPAAGDELGDFMLSVPIRTLVLEAPSGNDVRRGVMSVGAGIVHDSQADSEYAECLLKAQFLTGLSSRFGLIETLQASRREGARYLKLHLARLQISARHFGFSCDLAAIENDISRACAQLSNEAVHRLRLVLSHDGKTAIHTAPMRAIAHSPVRLLLAAQPMQSQDVFLKHKTTLRQRYDIAWQAAEREGAFDALFVNEKLHLTEGGRSNLFVRCRGQWLTPPLSDGVLPGVMRALLLADPVMKATEAALTLDDLRSADEVVVCSSLRGPLPAWVDWGAAPVQVA